ncbi:MAG: hypothetical protein EOP60_01080 [Sphingomonadales bacterium]|nr:MAG: hypothetical protein EOP60_01080 [Sphingomonadales bacterium]
MVIAKRPGWFIILVGVLILWGLAGCASFYAHVQYGPALDPNATDWDRAYFAALPAWFNWDYAVAVGAGLLGSVALLARSRWAGLLYIFSLIAVLIQFGYVFFATDLLAHKGAAMTVPFPAFIIAMAILQIWLAGYARDRNWTV